MQPTYYSMLGVHKASTPAEVDLAFKIAAFKSHPDRGGDPADFANLTLARATLKDNKTKQAYDRKLGIGKMACRTCKGAGVRYIQNRFTKHPTPCATCQGCGWELKERSK